MRHNVHKLWHTLPIALITITLLASCIGNKVYDQYDHTPIAGWEKNDTLLFSIPPMQQDALYHSDLLLRISQSYPFMSLTLIVDQTVWPSRATRTDTLKCRLINSDGKSNGQGLSYYQYSFPVSNMHLHKGDSLQISVRHNMKREILPGVSDIGIQLTRQ